MVDKILPLIYVIALGYIALRLCNAAFPKEEQIGARFIALFLILNITGFVLAGMLPLSYWVFFIAAVISLMILAPVEPVTRIATFLFLCPIMPNLDYDFQIGIPLLWMTWPRLLTIMLLLPLLFTAFRHKSAFHYPMDKYIWAFFLLNAALAFRDTSITNGLRGITYFTIDLLAPYFVLSRYLKTSADIRKVLFALLGALVFAGLINVFETVRTWHLYEQMIINVTGARFMAIERLGMLRATGPFSIPSQSAFAMATGLGLLWMLSPYLRRRLVIVSLVVILTLALLFTFSRGNWIAGVIIGMSFLFTANRKQFFRLGFAIIIIAVPLSFLEITDEVIGILPFIGEQETAEAGTVDYRASLFDTSIKVAKENPLFGSTTFGEHPDMDALRQSSGLLDLVNHYMIVLLSSGYVGLTLFLSIFISTFLLLFRTLLNSANQPHEHRLMCRAVMFTLAGLLVAITTTSALGRVGLLIWCLIAIAAVSCEILAPQRRPERGHSTPGYRRVANRELQNPIPHFHANQRMRKL